MSIRHWGFRQPPVSQMSELQLLVCGIHIGIPIKVPYRATIPPLSAHIICYLWQVAIDTLPNNQLQSFQQDCQTADVHIGLIDLIEGPFCLCKSSPTGTQMYCAIHLTTVNFL